MSLRLKAIAASIAVCEKSERTDDAAFIAECIRTELAILRKTGVSVRQAERAIAKLLRDEYLYHDVLSPFKLYVRGGFTEDSSWSVRLRHQHMGKRNSFRVCHTDWVAPAAA